MEGQAGSDEKEGLNMIFEVVGEISTPDGHVLMREIATQTRPSLKYMRIEVKAATSVH